MKSKLFYITPLFSLFLLAASALQAEVMTITSKNGKQMIVSLVSRQGEKVVIRRTSDNKEFAIDPSSLSKESETLVLDKMKALPVAIPPIESEISIGKRRKKDGNSDYMKQMEITSKITLTNKDYKIPCPDCTANIIFIGQDQKNTKEFKVLSNQQFTIKPTPKGAVQNTAPFNTRYDSDNKGEGNIGGHKYVGYLLVITGPDNEIVYTKTIYSNLRKALETDVSAAATIKTYPANTILGPDMKKPAPIKDNSGIQKL